MTTTKQSLPAELVELIESPALCCVATSMPDGSPQLTQTWVDTDGDVVVINSVPISDPRGADRP